MKTKNTTKELRTRSVDAAKVAREPHRVALVEKLEGGVPLLGISSTAQLRAIYGDNGEGQK